MQIPPHGILIPRAPPCHGSQQRLTILRRKTTLRRCYRARPNFPPWASFVRPKPPALSICDPDRNFRLHFPQVAGRCARDLSLEVSAFGMRPSVTFSYWILLSLKNGSPRSRSGKTSFFFASA